MWFNYNPVSITDASEVLFFLCCDQVQLKWQSYAVKVTLSEVKMWVTDNAFLHDIHSYASLILIATIFHSIKPLKQTMGSHLTTYSYQLCCWRNNTCFTFILGNFFSCFSFFFLKNTEGMFHGLSEDIQEFQVLWMYLYFWWEIKEALYTPFSMPKAKLLSLTSIWSWLGGQGKWRLCSFTLIKPFRLTGH